MVKHVHVICIFLIPCIFLAKESFRPREKWGESNKVEGRGWGRGKKGTLARKPLDFEKRPLVFTAEFSY